MVRCPPASSSTYFNVLAVMLALIFFLDGKLAFGARLGGAYYVDDAEIACVVDVGRPVEFGTSLVDIRFDGQEDILATVTAKTVPIPIGRTGFGLAIAEAIVYDPLNQTGSGLIVNVPLTFEFNKDFRLNLNFGAQYCSGGDPHGLFGTAGVGASWTSCRTGASSRRCSL
jgi:hypothetical protein